MSPARLPVCCLVALTITVLTACGMTGTVPVESPLYPFVNPDKEFSSYRNKIEAYLSTNSVAHRTTDDIALNLPFELSANPEVAFKGRFLLIHGLNDSAYVWHDIAQEMAALGFDVRALLLPGHGSKPDDMLDIEYQQWLTTARNHLAQVSEDDAPVYIGGFSLGGVIATILAIENRSIAGLLLVSPAFHSSLNHLLRWSWAYKRIQPWMFGTKLMEDNPAKYNSIPINSADQYFRTTRYLKNRWDNRRLSIPTLTIITTEDSVVDVSYTRKLMTRRFTHPDNTTIVYSDNENEPVLKGEIVRLSPRIDLRLLNQSHLSLINSPDNTLMGRNGSQLICNGNQPKVFFGCLRAKGHWFGRYNR